LSHFPRSRHRAYYTNKLEDDMKKDLTLLLAFASMLVCAKGEKAAPTDPSAAA